MDPPPYVKHQMVLPMLFWKRLCIKQWECSNFSWLVEGINRYKVREGFLKLLLVQEVYISLFSNFRKGRKGKNTSLQVFFRVVFNDLIQTTYTEYTKLHNLSSIVVTSLPFVLRKKQYFNVLL